VANPPKADWKKVKSGDIPSRKDLAKSLITLYYIFGYVVKTKLYEEAGLFFLFSLMAIETFKNHLILEFFLKSPQHPFT